MIQSTGHMNDFNDLIKKRSAVSYFSIAGTAGPR